MEDVVGAGSLELDGMRRSLPKFLGLIPNLEKVLRADVAMSGAFPGRFRVGRKLVDRR